MNRSSARRGVGSRLTAWAYQHRQALAATAAYVRAHASASLMTLFVIAIALALPGGLYLAVGALSALTERLAARPQATLYLEDATSLDRARGLASELGEDSRIVRAALLDRDTALAEFSASVGLGDALAVLEANPLPHAIELEIDPARTEGGAGDELLAELRKIPEVSDAEFDIAWLKRLQAITALAEHAVLLLATLLGLGVLLIVGNAIRAGIYNRRDEIEVAMLCGATDAFVRRPFLYSGALHGLAGGITACAILAAGFAFLGEPFRALLALYGSDYASAGLGLRPTAIISLAGLILGWAGAWLAVALYLREIDVFRD